MLKRPTAIGRCVDFARKEPVAIQGVVQTALAVLIGFGLLRWTIEQSGLIMAMTAAILALLARRHVTPNAKAEASGNQPSNPTA
jgi:uncharacterized membrane protein